MNAIQQPLPLVRASDVHDPEILDRLPQINSDIEVINKVISTATILTASLGGFLNRLEPQALDQWTTLHKDYVDLQKQLRDFTNKSKPDAQKRIDKFPTNYEGIPGSEAKKRLESASATLSMRNQDFLRKINALVHENKIQFPLPHTCPDSSGVFTRLKKSAANNAGWLFTGTTASVALCTLTPLGPLLAPYVAAVPKQLGDLCAAVGQFATDMLNATPVKDALASDRMITLGYGALCAAPCYPAYSYLKGPVGRFARDVLDAADKTVTVATKYPVVTFVAAFGASRAISSYTGADPLIEQYVQPLWVQGAAAGGTIGLIYLAKMGTDALKKKYPAVAPAPAAVPIAVAGPPVPAAAAPVALAGGPPPLAAPQANVLTALLTALRARLAALFP